MECNECGSNYDTINEYYTRQVIWQYDEEEKAWNAESDDLTDEPTLFTCPNCGSQVPPPETKGAY